MKKTIIIQLIILTIIANYYCFALAPQNYCPIGSREIRNRFASVIAEIILEPSYNRFITSERLDAKEYAPHEQNKLQNMLYTDDYDILHNIELALKLEGQDHVVLIGPWNKVRYLLLLALGHTVVVVEHESGMDRFAKLHQSFIEKLEEDYPDLFGAASKYGKISERITFVTMDITSSDQYNKLYREIDSIESKYREKIK